MQLLSNALSRFLSQRLKASLPFQLIALWRSWSEVVGEEVASLARPLGHRKQTILLGAEDPAALQEASYYEQHILERANAFLGKEYFDKVQGALLMGRSPLDAPTEKPWRPPVAPLQGPQGLGALLDAFRPDSPVSSSYKAYVRRMQDLGIPAEAPTPLPRRLKKSRRPARKRAKET